MFLSTTCSVQICFAYQGQGLQASKVKLAAVPSMEPGATALILFLFPGQFVIVGCVANFAPAELLRKHEALHYEIL